MNKKISEVNLAMLQAKLVPLAVIKPCPENSKLYKLVVASEPSVKALAESIAERGVVEPLVVTKDYFLLSGHRRRVASSLAGLELVPCRVVPIRYVDADQDDLLTVLATYNLQRKKTRLEAVREEVVTSSKEDVYDALIAMRYEKSDMPDFSNLINMGGTKTRKRISGAKGPFLAAIKRVLEERKKFLPLSDRSIHYALLNDPPLTHASKPKSRYANTKQFYNQLVELLTRARLAGEIPMDCIADETRPVDDSGHCAQEASDYVRRSIDSFLTGYWRDLQQGQPNHIEIVGEKNTLRSIILPVAQKYTIPLTTGRGYCSLPPRTGMAQRYKASGKEQLVLLIVSDLDPDGEVIASSFARSMRDDFGITKIVPIKVAINQEHVKRFNLPPEMKAKEGSVHHAKFVEKHGDDVFEVEAIPPAELQDIMRAAIWEVMDHAAFDAEVAAEKEDAAFLENYRRKVQAAMLDISEEK